MTLASLLADALHKAATFRYANAEHAEREAAEILAAIDRDALVALLREALTKYPPRYGWSDKTDTTTVAEDLADDLLGRDR